MDAEQKAYLNAISERMKIQDNQMTEHPLFCLQILIRDVGYDSNYASNRCWYDSANEQTIYDDDPGFVAAPEGDEWEEFGYRDRWETIMVAFTEVGLEEYMVRDGHNVIRRAYRGQTRIYVDTLRRCTEMIAIRKALLAGDFTGGQLSG
jgi:hypothetical protein